jgi:CheY-like chemotaxis protein
VSTAPCILVVHDEPVVSELLARLLGEAGYTVATVRAAQLTPAQARGVDLLLTDAYAPSGPADRVLLQLRHLFPELPIIHLDSIQPFAHDTLLASVALAIEERCGKPTERVPRLPG